jgi:hypothetical protein
MKRLVSSKLLSAAIIAGVFAAVGSLPAAAQTMSHDGSLLPHYFDKNGELKFGSWGPPAAEPPAAHVSRSLYLSAKRKHLPRAHAH